MAMCKIGGLLLRHFSIVFNRTTATTAVRSSVANWYIYIYTKFENFGRFKKFLLYEFLIWYDMKNLVYIW